MCMERFHLCLWGMVPLVRMLWPILNQLLISWNIHVLPVGFQHANCFVLVLCQSVVWDVGGMYKSYKAWSFSCAPEQGGREWCQMTCWNVSCPWINAVSVLFSDSTPYWMEALLVTQREGKFDLIRAIVWGNSFKGVFLCGRRFAFRCKVCYHCWDFYSKNCGYSLSGILIVCCLCYVVYIKLLFSQKEAAALQFCCQLGTANNPIDFLMQNSDPAVCTLWFLGLPQNLLSILL